MPGSRQTDAARKKFSDYIFKRSNLSDMDKMRVFALDAFMVQILVALDGKKNIRLIYQDTKIPMDQLRESIIKLAEQGLVEPISKKEQLLDKAFFDALSAEIAHIVGPISSILIDEALSDLKLAPNHFPASRVAELIGALSGEIKQKEKRLGFQKNMINLLKERGYLKGAESV